MRREWAIAVPCAVLFLATIVRKKRVPEIEAVPNLVALPMVYHEDVRGYEGWIFTGPEKSSIVVDRLERGLSARGWTRRGNEFYYPAHLPLGGLLDIFGRFHRSRANSGMTLTVQSGRMMPAPPLQPLKGDWTTVMIDSMHAMSYSGPGAFPFWKTYR